MSYFVSPHAEYRAQRIKQMLEEVDETLIFAKPTGQVMVSTNGHMFLFDLNELGQLYKLDSADIIRPRTDTTVTIS